MSKLKDKLIRRLLDEHNLNIDKSTFTRNYLTLSQRSSGFTSWNAKTYSGEVIGSQWSINICANSKKLEVFFDKGVYLICPED